MTGSALRGSLLAVTCAALVGWPLPTATAGPLAELDALEQELAALQTERAALSARARQLDEALARSETDLAAATARQDELVARLRRHLRVLHGLHGGGRLATVLLAPSPQALHQREALLRHLAGKRRRLWSAARHGREALLAARSGVLRVRGDLLATRALADQRADRLQQRRQELLRAAQRLSADPRAVRAAAAELTDSVAALGAAAGPEGAEPPPSGATLLASKGRLPPPCAGALQSKFGVVRLPRLGIVLRQPGVEVQAPVGTPVRAVHAGRVVFAGRLPGLAGAVVVAHGPRHHTVYARLSGAQVAVGALVPAGALLGRVGSTLLNEVPGLHFEVRQDGVAVDPRPWLRRRR